MKIETFYEKMLEILPELNDDTIKEIVKYDKKIAEYCDKAAEAEIKYFKICKNLSDEERKTVNDYLTAYEVMACRNYSIFYFAGMSDMYKMIRIFEKCE